MRRYLFFTKTLWNEPPRLRHQLAELLARAGNEVIFFQKPSTPGRPAPGMPQTPNGIRLVRHRELMHHKLRVGPVARVANAAYTTRCLGQRIANLHCTESDIVVNFNYEYYFLRRIFPRNPIITIINDDFISSAPRIAQPSLRKAQRLTCRMSDAVLTPSVALQEELAADCPAELFLPWADVNYTAPPAGIERNGLFFWGYIGRRIDFAWVERLAASLRTRMPAVKIDFFGPTQGDAASHPLFRSYPNVRLRGSASLSDVPLDEMMGSIIPYVLGVPDVDAVVIPNKAMQLLARGLPLAITGMPRFERAPFVRRLDEGDAVRALGELRQDFDRLQGPIRDYIQGNGGEARLMQFLSIVERASSAGVRR
ncbi:MAG: glycosyltransferase family 1 protein [Planctomycetes bacterium]|nr:glycosyltransferase family 1 protein [Planctomycetota bacterium]